MELKELCHQEALVFPVTTFEPNNNKKKTRKKKKKKKRRKHVDEAVASKMEPTGTPAAAWPGGESLFHLFLAPTKLNANANSCYSSMSLQSEHPGLCAAESEV